MLELHDAYGVGDHVMTLALCEDILRERPNDPDALTYASLSRAQLEASYLSALGGSELLVPILKIDPRWDVPPVDDQTASILDLLDGARTLGLVLEDSRLRSLFVLHTLYCLLRDGFLELV